MAAKTRLLADVIAAALSRPATPSGIAFNEQMRVFRRQLLQDISPPAFADLYAQTIAYGMLAARAGATDAAPFTRAAAGEHIPKSNPFVRRLFIYLTGADIDESIKWIVDDMAALFAASDVRAILRPKRRGVWYTPVLVSLMLQYAFIARGHYGAAGNIPFSPQNEQKTTGFNRIVSAVPKAPRLCLYQ